jgi:hypothetical protein
MLARLVFLLIAFKDIRSPLNGSAARVVASPNDVSHARSRLCWKRNSTIRRRVTLRKLWRAARGHRSAPEFAGKRLIFWF